MTEDRFWTPIRLAFAVTYLLSAVVLFFVVVLDF